MKKIFFLISIIGVVIFTGCAGKSRMVAGITCDKYVEPSSKNSTLVAITASYNGSYGPSREAMRKGTVKNLFQAIAMYGINIKKPYFHIIKPAKFERMGINNMEDADKACIEQSGNALSSAFSLFDNTGINRGCEFTLGGDYVKVGFADVEFFTKPQLKVLTFNAYDVIKYLKEKGYYITNNDYDFYDIAQNLAYLCRKNTAFRYHDWYAQWERSTKWKKI